MIEGVEILSQTNVYEYTESGWLLFLFFGIGFVGGLILAIIMWIDFGFNVEGIFGIIACTGLGLIIGVMAAKISKEPTNIVDYVEYKVTISDEVNFNEFADKYEILDQEGKIYTVKEKS